MTLAELNIRLQHTGLPVAYRAWPEDEAPALPFICYFCTGSASLYADASNYHVWNEVQVELYTALKNPEAEASVEKALSGLRWKKTEIYIDTERCYQILYEIEV